MAGATEAVRPEVLFPAGGREAAAPFHRQLLAQQPALPLLPLLPGHCQHRAVHPQSLLLPQLLHVERLHPQPILHAVPSLR